MCNSGHNSNEIKILTFCLLHSREVHNFGCSLTLTKQQKYNKTSHRVTITDVKTSLMHLEPQESAEARMRFENYGDLDDFQL